MSTRVKSLFGVYKVLGRDAFLAAARVYSDHVQPTVEATLAAMESSWYNTGHTVTEADKMLEDYRLGLLTRASAEELLAAENLERKFFDGISRALESIRPGELERSYQNRDHDCAGELLRDMHDVFLDTYGTEYLDCSGYEMVHVPAVIRARKTGQICLGVVLIDLHSAGEHWGTEFITPYGVVRQGDSNASAVQQDYIRRLFPYDYWYTADYDGDIHINCNDIPEDVEALISYARVPQECVMVM